jgi:hypothetical protein
MIGSGPRASFLGFDIYFSNESNDGAVIRGMGFKTGGTNEEVIGNRSRGDCEV